jgi:hypothetical protein
MRRFTFTLTGFMPLLMHSDDILGADSLEKWRKDPHNKNISKAGDDRSPAWTWQTYIYRDGNNIVMPGENIMAALKTAGAQLILKKQKTFKEITQSGLLIDGESCEFLNNGKRVSWKDIADWSGEPFDEQAKRAEKAGFTLHMKRVRIGTAKHIRVRPKFDNWSVRGEIMVLKPEITNEILAELFKLAGRAGICDWRPSAKSPGPYGQFTAELEEIK